MPRFCMLLVGALIAVPAFAQDGKGGKKAQVIDFEDDTIEGDITRPDGEYIEAGRAVKHSNLIRVREEFKDKVMESVDAL